MCYGLCPSPVPSDVYLQVLLQNGATPKTEGYRAAMVNDFGLCELLKHVDSNE